MRFCLNSAVYIVANLDKIVEALGLEDDDLETILSVIYVTTRKALSDNMDTLLRLGIHTGELEREQGDIIAENEEFRAFMSAVEATYPTALIKAQQVLEDIRNGRLVLGGGSTVAFLEK